MGRIFYENFDLLVTRTGDKKYRALVFGALGGDASIEFSFEQAPEEVQNSIGRNFGLVNPNGSKANGATSDVVGKYLFETIFGDANLRTAFELTLDRAKKRQAFLRIRLNLSEVPELVGLPWEMLTSPKNPLALAIQTSIVRYQNIPAPQEDLLVTEKPLQMLVVVSNPSTGPFGPLNVEKEFANIELALKPLTDQGLVKLHRLPSATLTALDDWLFQNTTHIFHFIGHGAFDKTTGKGQLVFEGSGDGPAYELVDGARLGLSLNAEQSLKLATLNACEGAVVSDTDCYAGVAQQLLRTGNVPVVVAMRRVIGDYIAIAFAEIFFEWLLEKNLSVDGALTRARLAMLDAENKAKPGGTPTEWGTPVLFMRDHGGYLVDFNKTAIEVPRELPRGIESQVAKHYQAVLNSMINGKLVPFLGLDINLYGRRPVRAWTPGQATLPGYSELVDYLVSKSGHPAPYLPALADASQYALLVYANDADLGVGDFYNDLNQIFVGVAVPNSQHRFWAQLAAANDRITGALGKSVEDVNRRFLIVSSTYDNLLEKAFSQTLDRFHVVSYISSGTNEGKFRHIVYAKTPGGETQPQAPVVIDSANNYGPLYDRAPVILKIPGAVGDGAGLRVAITEDEYLDLFSRHELGTILPTQLLTKLRSSKHLFLGYNVREWSLRALLYRIWEDNKPPNASWTVQEPEVHPGLISNIQKEYWKACGVTVIERSLTQYIDELQLSCKTWLEPEAKT